MSKSIINILSLDGGGVRGYLPLKLFKKCGYKTEYLNEKFDYIIGTSTGGLIATGIRSGLSIDKMLKIFDDNNNFKRIFKKRWLYGYFGLTGEKYDGDSFIDFLKNENYFNNKCMKDIKKPLLITSYDLMNSSPVVFKSYKKTHKDMFLYDILRSTTAAPTYFKPHKIYYNNKERNCIDGGVWANDPALTCFIECMIHLSQGLTDNQDDINPTNFININNYRINIISIGTGKFNQDRSNYCGGIMNWATKVVDFLMETSGDGNDFIFEGLSRSIDCINMKRHQFNLPQKIFLDKYEEIDKLRDIELNINEFTEKMDILNNIR